MGLFDKKEVKALESEVKGLKVEVASSLEMMQEQTRAISQLEKKGYFDNQNAENEYFKQVFKLQASSVKLLDFNTVDRASQVKYYESNAIVRGIVGTTIGNAVGELSQYIELVDKNGKEILDHWAIKLLNRPNDLYSKKQLLKGWSINRNLTGDAFVYGEEGIGLSKGQFKNLYLMNSQDVQIVREKDTPIIGYTLTNANYLYSTSGLTSKNVMFSREYNTDSTTLYGLSPLLSAASYVQLIEASLKRQNASITNGGVSTIITPKGDELGVTQTQAANVEEELNSKHSGNYSKYFKVPIEVHKLGDTPVDLSILDTSKYAITALCFVYGLPVDVFLSEGKFANAKEYKKSVYEQAAVPMVNEFIGDFNNFCGFTKGEHFILNTDKVEILRDSSTEMMNTYNAANMSINERRGLLGFEPLAVPYADLPMIPLGMTFGYEPVIPIDENI